MKNNKRSNVRKKTEQFIEEARQIHGDKYDYSKVVYLNNRTKICIICPEHGEFMQTPANHLKGQGCPFCVGNVKLTTEDFIQRARKVHGDKYDYSKVNYIKNSTKVCIICPIHGEFWQTPNNHLNGHNCPKCIGRGAYKSTTQEFIEKARQVHGDKYDYSKVKYIDSKTKVCIICTEHGEFLQSTTRHLRGAGCPFCAGNKVTNEQVRTKIL